MGLDMYAYTAPEELVGDKQVDFEDKLFKNGEAVEGVNTNFAYWRKFNHLHGWMKQLYYKKGGKSSVFNCNAVRLTSEDINILESLATLKALSPTQGFFFGPDDLFSDDDKEEVLDFVRKCRDAFASNKAVVYNSWW